jgi:hypothetical protein
VVQAAGNSQTQYGERVRVGIPAAACYVFDPKEQAFERPAYS